MFLLFTMLIVFFLPPIISPEMSAFARNTLVFGSVRSLNQYWSFEFMLSQLVGAQFLELLEINAWIWHISLGILVRPFMLV